MPDCEWEILERSNISASINFYLLNGYTYLLLIIQYSHIDNIMDLNEIENLYFIS